MPFWGRVKIWVSFTQLFVYVCYSKLIHSYYYITFHCLNISWFISSLLDEYFGFPVMAIMNHSAVYVSMSYVSFAKLCIYFWWDISTQTIVEPYTFSLSRFCWFCPMYTSTSKISLRYLLITTFLFLKSHC